MGLDPKFWGPSSPLEGLSESHLRRARRRKVWAAETHLTWAVEGLSALGDVYDFYEVRYDEETDTYSCSCEEHTYGELRRRCTHRTAVILWRVEHSDPVEWERSAAVAAAPVGADKPATAVLPSASSLVSHPAPTEPEEEEWLLTSPHDLRLGDPPLPDHFAEFRPGQWEAVQEIAGHYARGVRVVMLSAPTGSGKTLIAELVRRVYCGENIGKEGALYTCSTKTLQDQVMRDFPYARTIKGRNNYPTMVEGVTADACTAQVVQGPQCRRCSSDFEPSVKWTDGSMDRTYTHCFWCHPVGQCPYRMAKEEALASPLPVLNMAYYLNEVRNSYTSKFSGRKLLVVDEADVLEDELMRQIEYVSTPGSRVQLGVRSLPKKTVADDWRRWLRDVVLPAALLRRKLLRGQLGRGEPDPTLVQRARRLDSQAERIEEVVNSLGGEGTAEWILTGYENREMKDARLTFKPVRVGELARPRLWDTADHFLLMSATLVCPEQLAADLGLEDNEWAVVEMGSAFPMERRPIFIEPRANMTQKTKGGEWPKMGQAVERVIEDNPGKRILVHTVSYDLARWIVDHHQNGRLVTYWSSAERDAALEKFLGMEDGVLLAPSFERGVDLPNDDCRVIVIAKVPFPYLGDKQVSTRLYGTKGGRQWYVVETIRTVVQMTGRGMRSAEDWCDTFILDKQFLRLWREHRRFFPRWWREAVVFDRNDPKVRERLEGVAR